MSDPTRKHILQLIARADACACWDAIPPEAKRYFENVAIKLRGRLVSQ